MAISRRLTPIDRISILTIIVLSVLLAGLVSADQVCGTDCWFKANARVEDFNWEDKRISAHDRAFILTFSRPMDRQTVEENLSIEPDLPGKISWAGRRMAYTLEEPMPYGTEYDIQLKGAQERLGSEINPFQAHIKARDRAFVYLGVKGEEQGRLILFNLTQQEKTILTPPELVVNDFESYPQRDRILFTATPQDDWEQGEMEQKLYTVTTGLNSDTAPRELNLVLDNQNDRILDFQLAPDGEKIVVRRANKNDSGEVSFWLLQDNSHPQRLETDQGGHFMIAPDSQTLAITQAEGINLIPLEDNSDPDNSFLPQYGQVLTFSSDGTAAAMINFNTQDVEKQYTRSLYLVTTQGVQKELVNTDGSIRSCEFNPKATHLYCVLTEMVEGESYQEQPFLISIDLDTSEVTPIMTFPKRQQITMSLSPDGHGILFDQISTATESTPDETSLRTNAGEPIIGSRLWLLISGDSFTDDDSGKLEELPLVGLAPQWLP